MILGMLFCVCLIAANLLEAKQVEVAGLSLTAGLIVFPVSYVINDCIVEVYGYVKARLVIWLGFFMNFLFVLFSLPICSPPHPTGQGRKASMPSSVWHPASPALRSSPFWSVLFSMPTS